MKPALVVDTNVPIAANARGTDADAACQAACIDALLRARDSSIILLDVHGEILREYRPYLSPTGQPGTGDAFFKWLWNNQANTEHCVLVQIHPHPERVFEEFPAARDLAAFDRSDRKFVAVAIASALQPRVLNALDSDWRAFADALLAAGVMVECLCPHQVRCA